MSRVSKEQAQLNKAAITTASARLFRQRGLKGVSVAELMAEVGLTHGGFYGHFDSKEALEAEACREAFDGAVAVWRKRVAGAAEDARATLIGKYLSTRSRDSSGTGCPSASLAGDVAREPVEAPIRDAYVAGTEQLLAILAAIHDSGDAAADRQRALSDFSTMVGALVLARATAGHSLSNEILTAARDALDESPGESPKRVPARRGG